MQVARSASAGYAGSAAESKASVASGIITNIGILLIDLLSAFSRIVHAE